MGFNRSQIKRRRRVSEQHKDTHSAIEAPASITSALKPPQPTAPLAAETPTLVDSVLLSSFVHQVINPLSGIVGTLYVLETQNFGEEKRTRRLRATRSQLSHTIEMVRNLAFLAQLSTDHGSSSLRSAAVKTSVEKLIIDALQFFQESAARKKVKLHLEDESTQHHVKTHAELLKHVFINLFDNAVKYADEGTEVTISCRRQKSTGHLIVEVSNTGDGFSHDEREKIFEIGYRGKIAKAKTSNGSGIGLYVCKRILAILHNASIEGEHSGAKRLTTIRIRFPEVELGARYEKPKESTNN
jgi:signal transduction histidine kinase